MNPSFHQEVICDEQQNEEVREALGPQQAGVDEPPVMGPIEPQARDWRRHERSGCNDD
jgi:hypothetical protein